jgi:molybdopterin adenylyltransferase
MNDQLPMDTPGSGGNPNSKGDFARFGIVTVSDRASRGEYEDEGGPALLEFFQEAIDSKWEAVYRVVPDESDAIQGALIELADVHHCSVIVTTGGTGPATRDITPEATESVCERILPGFGEQMRAISLKFVPTAILSRQLAGTRGKSLIINLPGKPKSIRETIDEIFKAVPYCVDLIEGPYIECKAEVVDAFRPKNARR